MRQANEVVDQLILAVQFVFLFALAAGVLVLYAALISTEDERRREVALMRVVGATRRQVVNAQRIEFLAMGTLVGVLATAAAATIGQVLASRAFDLDLPVNPWLWLIGRWRALRCCRQRLALRAHGAGGAAGIDVARLRLSGVQYNAAWLKWIAHCPAAACSMVGRGRGTLACGAAATARNAHDPAGGGGQGRFGGRHRAMLGDLHADLRSRRTV